MLPVTSDSSPVQGLPPPGCEGLLSPGRCSCLCVSVCPQTTPKPGQPSPAANAQENQHEHWIWAACLIALRNHRLISVWTHQMAKDGRTQRAGRSWRSAHIKRVKNLYNYTASKHKGTVIQKKVISPRKALIKDWKRKKNLNESTECNVLPERRNWCSRAELICK